MIFVSNIYPLCVTGESVQTRRQTDSQTARVGHGHEPGGRPAPTSHRPTRRRSDQRPGPRGAQRQHSYAHVRPIPVCRPAGLLPGLGLRSGLASHEVRVHCRR